MFVFDTKLHRFPLQYLCEPILSEGAAMNHKQGTLAHVISPVLSCTANSSDDRRCTCPSLEAVLVMVLAAASAASMAFAHRDACRTASFTNAA
jgi:hypothetical protein